MKYSVLYFVFFSTFDFKSNSCNHKTALPAVPKCAIYLNYAPEGVIFLWVKKLKGTVSRDFLLQVFFMNPLPPSP